VTTKDDGRLPAGHATHEQSQQDVSAVPVGIVDADHTALSYWFPKVEAAGLPVPLTRTAHMPKEVMLAVGAVMWGEEADDSGLKVFADELRAAASGVGTPFFLRTDHTSGKHQWDSACFVSDPAAIERHIYQIAEYSEMAGFLGLPWLVWAVREMLPTMPVSVCPNYGNMPVCKEFRFFVDGGTVECFHPYWPRYALEQGGCDLSDDEFSTLCDPGDIGALSALASRAGAALGGRWSVDLLETERGWFLTDMAEAHKSFHWEDCPAQAIEAGTAETERLSPKGESAVGVTDAPNTPQGGSHEAI
jgi:hypothetical protein